MWYFTWILGLSAALLLSVLNAMWYEAQDTDDE
ncbi:MAG: Membrane bound YbgT-like protein [Proteobacteria bacterium]|nr:Membrane bound YbgT-like protein [Pseudomonadota bacterium]